MKIRKNWILTPEDKDNLYQVIDRLKSSRAETSQGKRFKIPLNSFENNYG